MTCLTMMTVPDPCTAKFTFQVEYFSNSDVLPDSKLDEIQRKQDFEIEIELNPDIGLNALTNAPIYGQF